MYLTKKEGISLFAIIFSLYVIAWLTQDSLFLNWDNSQLLHATRLMLSGGTYSKDFFIPNPPMILWLYTPPVIISQWLNSSVVLPFRLYIFLISSISLLTCYFLIKRIFAKEDSLLGCVFLITLTSLFLILPLYLLGQRDCLLFILIMPYLLLMTARLQGGQITPQFAIFIGLLAGFGLGSKPHFLAVPCLIECYYAISKKSILAWFRIETITLFSFFLVYSLAVLVFYPDFISIVVPYVLQLYYPSISWPFTSLLLNPILVFCYLPIVFYFQYRKKSYSKLCTVLLLALLGFIYTYFSQHTLFLYHILPAFFTAILLLVMQYSMFALDRNINSNDYLTVAVVAFAAGMILFNYDRNFWLLLIFHPYAFFVFFTILLTALFYYAEPTKNLLIFMAYTACIIAISFWSNYIARRTSFYPYHYSITLFILFSLFIVFVSKKHRNRLAQTYTLLLGILIFAMPACTFVSINETGVYYKQQVLNGLLTFMKTQPPRQSIFALTINGNYSAPLMHYTDVKALGRFDCLWMVLGLSKKISLEGEKSVRQYIAFNQNPYFFINMVTEDLRSRPDLVFVDVAKHNSINQGKLAHFDYLSYFSENSKFRSEWKNYRYLTTISAGNPNFYSYKLDVYKRNK